MDTLLSVVPIVIALLNAAIGINIYKAQRKSPLNIVFLFWCFSLAVWFIASYVVYTGTEPHHIWFRIASLGWCFYYPFALYWILVFTKSRILKIPLLKYAFFLPGFIFLFQEPIDNAYYIYNLIYSLACIAALSIWVAVSGRTYKTIKQAKILVTAIASALLLTYLTPVLLPDLGDVFFHYLNPIYSMALILGAYYVIKYYILVSIPVQRLNDVIFEKIMDVVILITPDGIIQRTNISAELLLGYKNNTLIGKPIHSIIHDDISLDALLCSDSSSLICHYIELQLISASGSLTPVNLSFIPLMHSRNKNPYAVLLIGQDISITKQLEKQIIKSEKALEKLHISENRFKDIFEKNSAVMYLLDFDTLEIVDTNRAARIFYGYSKEEFKNKKITDLNGLTEEQEKETIKGLSTENLNIFHFKHMAADGQWRDVEVRSTPIKMYGRMLIISIVADITDRKKAEEKISYLAYHDELTGLVNRKYFYERVESELKRALRKNIKAAILFLDLDGFKSVNDKYGHKSGDYLLKEVARRLKGVMRETDTVARMGGDEFTILIVDIEGKSSVEAVVQKIEEALSTPIIIDGESVFIKSSIGSSIFPDDSSDINQLLNIADREMYKMKNSVIRL